MFEDLPPDVKKELDQAVSDIRQALLAANERLIGASGQSHPDDYGTVGATLYFNDPAIEFIFRRAQVLLVEETEGEEFAMRSYSTANCHGKACYNPRECCNNNCDGYRCKEGAFYPGDPPCYACGRSKRC
jgi:hypothetical protein